MFVIKKYNNEFDLKDYIGNNYNKCLYLYLDYVKYGNNNDKVKIFYQQNDNNEIKCILLNYYTALHVYSNDCKCNYKELAEFIRKGNYLAVFGEKNIIANLVDYLPNYESEYGFVRKSFNDSLSTTEKVESAKITDFEEIVDLIMIDDDLASSYNREVLLKQLKERYLEKFSRNYIIRKDNKIVAHVSTNGEIDKYACISLVIVHPQYRKKGLAKAIVSKMTNDLSKEKKELYLMNYSDISSKLYDGLGFKISCECGKLFLKR